MESSKILSASWLDLLFDNRNKAYGAYDLRRTYPRRVKKALFLTLVISVLFITVAGMGNGKQHVQFRADDDEGMIITPITETQPPEPDPEPVVQQQVSEPVQTVILAPPRIVDDETIIDRPMASQSDLLNAQVGTDIVEGIPFTGISQPSLPGEPTGFIDPNKNKEPDGPLVDVQVPSRFIGDWVKFLRRHLDPNTPLDHGAPPGRYTVLIQFVVDREGNVSDIKPLTNIGYGMEEEAVRVLKKATRWEPAIQNGYPVKAYHKQPITFEVIGEE